MYDLTVYVPNEQADFALVLENIRAEERRSGADVVGFVPAQNFPVRKITRGISQVPVKPLAFPAELRVRLLWPNTSPDIPSADIYFSANGAVIGTYPMSIVSNPYELETAANERVTEYVSDRISEYAKATNDANMCDHLLRNLGYTVAVKADSGTVPRLVASHPNGQQHSALIASNYGLQPSVMDEGLVIPCAPTSLAESRRIRLEAEFLSCFALEHPIMLRSARQNGKTTFCKYLKSKLDSSKPVEFTSTDGLPPGVLLANEVVTVLSHKAGVLTAFVQKPGDAKVYYAHFGLKDGALVFLSDEDFDETKAHPVLGGLVTLYGITD